jgi:hypothetical protein
MAPTRPKPVSPPLNPAPAKPLNPPIAPPLNIPTDFPKPISKKRRKPNPKTNPKPEPIDFSPPENPNPEECKKPCEFSIDEYHLFHPDTRSGNLQGFHSTARTIETIDYNWESPPDFEADFEPFGAYFTIPGQTQFEPKFSTFFPINATDFAVIEAIGEAYIKSGCIPTGVWSASVHNPVTGEAMGIQGTVQNHVILTAFPSI